MLEVRGLFSGYGKIEILHGVSLEVKESEIVALIGPNGAGKSTVLKTIVGLLKGKGSILFKGEEISSLSSHILVGKGLSYVPQGRIVFPRMSVLENLEMGAYLEKRREKIEEALQRVYGLFPVLKERKEQKAATLSGGEQQMLAMGRALMQSPSLLLLDEPSLGLAPKYVSLIFQKILEMRKKVTMLIVEQNAARALEIADRGYVLELGQNRFEGSGRELLNNPEVRRLYLGG
ncbi:MAG: ABC transporter ATP-binding protein [Euryarchaeota archaeon]|nr:ABC transporter ATP-binding protein [Euryarchaeota archaeon]